MGRAMLRPSLLLVLLAAAGPAAAAVEPVEVAFCPLPGTVPVCTVVKVPPDVSNEGLSRLICPVAPAACP